MIIQALANLMMNKEEDEPQILATSPIVMERIEETSGDKVDAKSFLEKCMDIRDSFTYDDMLYHYCDAVNYLGELGSLINGCIVRTNYSKNYITVTLIFCDSSKQPIKLKPTGLNDYIDYERRYYAWALDAKFLQFMKGRSEAYFTPTIQEIVQRMKK